MRIPRKNPELNDVVEVLDERLREATRADDKNSIKRAWDSLQPDELAVVDKEIASCLNNRRYYLENYHCIRTESGIIKTLYPFWDHQELVFDALTREWTAHGTARLIVLKPRQAGLTTWCGGVIFHSTIFVPHTYSLTMAQDEKVSLEIFTRLLDSYNNLPWWLRPEFASKQQGLHVIFQRADEERRMMDPGLGSTLLVSNSQRGSGVVIGRTVRNAHFSETSRWPDAEVFTGDIEPSMNAPDTLAFMESTAYGRVGLFYNMWKGATDGEIDWTPVFIPAYRVRKYVLPLKPEEAKSFRLTKDEKEVRAAVKQKENFTIPLAFFNWRRRRIKQTVVKTGREDSHYESYPINPGEAFVNSGFCAFPKYCLNEQEIQNVVNPLFIGEIEYVGPETLPRLHLRAPSHPRDLKKPRYENRLWIWEQPDANDAIEYQLGCDVSSGDGADYSDACVWRVGQGNSPDTQVAEWHGLTNPAHFAKILAALGIYYHMAEIACEYMGPGITTGNELLHTLDYPNLYRWKHLDKIANSTTSYVHWMTTSKTRPALFDRMNEALLDKTVVIRSHHLLEEMRDCGREDEDSRVEGLNNNDDMVMASQIGLYTLRERRRLEFGGSASASSSSAAARLISTLPQVFGLYDEFSRQIGQFEGRKKAEDFLARMEEKYRVQKGGLGLKIIPIQVMKANTPYSPIYDGQGAEAELYRQGMKDRAILPDIVQLYREIMTRQHYEGDSD